MAVFRLSRVIRGLWPDGNPLRRRCDRAEGAIVAALLVGFLAGAPLAALAAGHGAYTASLRTERMQYAARHQTPAILLEDAPAAAFGRYGASPRAAVQAWWAMPGGAPRTGKITVTAGARAGSTVLVWADKSGQLHSPPLQHAKVTSRAVLAAALAPAGLGLLLLYAGKLARRALDRQRLAAWEADWWATGPHWTGIR